VRQGCLRSGCPTHSRFLRMSGKHNATSPCARRMPGAGAPRPALSLSKGSRLWTLIWAEEDPGSKRGKRTHKSRQPASPAVRDEIRKPSASALGSLIRRSQCLGHGTTRRLNAILCRPRGTRVLTARPPTAEAVGYHLPRPRRSSCTHSVRCIESYIVVLMTSGAALLQLFRLQRDALLAGGRVPHSFAGFE